MGAFIAEASRQAGHLGATVLRPNSRAGPSGSARPGDGTYRFVYKFDKRSNLEAWHGSSTRAELFLPIRELVIDDRFNEYPGLETWFDLPSHETPPKWKTTLLSWGAIYLLVVLFSYLMQSLGIRLPIPISALLLTGLVVPLVAYLVGPLLGKLFHAWLHPYRTG